MRDLAKCPFCGSEEVEIVLENDENYGRCWFVQCQHCYAEGTSVIEGNSSTEPVKPTGRCSTQRTEPLTPGTGGWVMT